MSVQETLAMMVLISSVAIILTLIMHINGNMDCLISAKQGLFLAIFAQKKTGFSRLNITNLNPLVKSIVTFSMAIGGDVGSTAGGFKILRMLIIVKLMQLAIQRTAMPSHVVSELSLGGCPRIEAVARESCFESDFLII